MTRRFSPAALVTGAVVALAVAFVFLQLSPSLLFANTTPAGGDMGAHVWAPAFLRDHLLPHFRLTGWAPDWYAGFPLLHFYFPLPSILVVAVGTVIPYDIAFKLVTVAGVLALPVCAYAFARLAGLDFPAPPLFAVATLPFLFDRFHTIYGGNIPATLAGEFAFSIALALALLFLGVFARGLEDGRHRGWAAVLLAATALSHLLPTLFAIAGAGVLLLLRIDRRRLRYALTSLPVALLLASFWVLPFWRRLPYSNDMGWEKIRQFSANLFPFLSPCKANASCAAGEFPHVQTWHLLPVTVLAAIAVGIALARRERVGLFLSAMATGAAIVFVTAPPARLWNARALPFWFLSLYLLAAYAVDAGVRWLAAGVDRRDDAPIAADVEPGGEDTAAEVLDSAPPRPDRGASVLLASPLVALVLVAVFIALPLGSLPGWVPLSTSDHSFVPDWVKWNYSGYERKAKYPEYKAVVSTMAKVGDEYGCGRAMWEYRPELNDYGTPMALMLLPYWTHECIGSMEGLYFESAATTPYHFLMQSELSKQPSRAQRDLPYRDLDLALGVKHMQLMGVRYYMAVSPEAIAAANAQPDLELIATSTPWQIYRVADAPLVQPLEFQPAVIDRVPDTNGHWMDVAVPWFDDPSQWDVPLAEHGPKSWPRVHVADRATSERTVGSDVTVSTPERVPVRPARVSDIRTSDDRISFDVDRPGAPVLVKSSYFPNWKASGADGPWRVSPNLMVVVPTSTHVSLHYGRTPIDWLGMAATVAGIALVVVLWRRGPVAYPAREVGGRDDEADGVTDDGDDMPGGGDAPEREAVVVDAGP
jgi:hypothetical protein